MNQCISGDVLVLLPMKERRGSIYATKIRLIEADRVGSPWVLASAREDKTKDGAARIFGGVELSDDGEVEAYWVSRRHPGAGVAASLFNGSLAATQDDYERLPAFGAETGRPIALLVGEMERPEQRRAVPLMAKCLTELKNLSRYVESTTVQNVIKSYFTAFVTSAMPSTEMFSGIVDDDALTDFWQRDPYHVKLGPGIVNWMRPGDSITFPINAGPESEFEPYTTALVKYIGACTGHSVRGLAKAIQRLLFREPRVPFAILEPRQGAAAVAGRSILPAGLHGLADGSGGPGHHQGAAVFRRPARISRVGTVLMERQLRPAASIRLKEVMAADRRVKLGVSTLERECLEINGQRLAREHGAARARTHFRAGERACHIRATRRRKTRPSRRNF